MMHRLRIGLAYLAAVAAAFVLASVLHSQFVLFALAGIGARIPIGDWLGMTAGDVAGLFPAYALVIAAALAAGFAIAGLALRWLKPLARVAYPLAGFAAVATALWLMSMQFETTPLAGARGMVGFTAQCLAGALGGWLFARLLRPWRGASGRAETAQA